MTPHTLLNKTQAEVLAEGIDKLQREWLAYTEAVFKSIESKAATPGQQQNVMDVFGENAAEVLRKYGVVYAAVLDINPETGVPAPNLDIYQPQPDGTVLYVSPPETSTPQNN
jgi:hypothetical protein